MIADLAARCSRLRVVWPSYNGICTNGREQIINRERAVFRGEGLTV